MRQRHLGPRTEFLRRKNTNCSIDSAVKKRFQRIGQKRRCKQKYDVFYLDLNLTIWVLLIIKKLLWFRVLQMFQNEFPHLPFGIGSSLLPPQICLSPSPPKVELSFWRPALASLQQNVTSASGPEAALQNVHLLQQNIPSLSGSVGVCEDEPTSQLWAALKRKLGSFGVTVQMWTWHRLVWLVELWPILVHMVCNGNSDSNVWFPKEVMFLRTLAKAKKFWKHNSYFPLTLTG